VRDERITYILIEVRERDKPDYYTTDAGLIRKHLHNFLTEHGQIKATDMIYKEGGRTTYYGTPNHWHVLRGIFAELRHEIDRRRVLVRMRAGG
jgi:hypothetical protein